MTETPEATPAPSGSTPGATDPISEAVAAGYRFDGPALELGGLMLDAETLGDARIRIPLAMLNRHGLVAGATGTGKTKTLQLLAEQLSAQGVPVFAADIKGDLSGLGVAGEPSDKLSARTASVGQEWTATAFPTELYAIGGQGTGVPVRVTMSAFGPTLLAKVLDLNETQESSLGLVFYYCDSHGLPLLDLADLRAVLQYLTADAAGRPSSRRSAGCLPRPPASSCASWWRSRRRAPTCSSGSRSSTPRTSCAPPRTAAASSACWSCRTCRTVLRCSRPSSCGCSRTSSTTCRGG